MGAWDDSHSDISLTEILILMNRPVVTMIVRAPRENMRARPSLSRRPVKRKLLRIEKGKMNTAHNGCQFLWFQFKRRLSQ